MKKTHYPLAFLLLCFSLLFASCATTSQENTSEAQAKTDTLAFTPVKNYFVNNTVDSSGLFLLNTNEACSALFGMATLMGPNGKPTTFNAETQTLLAYILPETDTATEIIPVRVERIDSNTLQFCCRITRGDSAMTYRIRPFSAVIIEKQAQQQIRFLEVTK
ncbi:MAG: hypothetical protein ACR2IL_04260 [Chitinophagaceae bacterium]